MGVVRLVDLAGLGQKLAHLLEEGFLRVGAAGVGAALDVGDEAAVEFVEIRIMKPMLVTPRPPRPRRVRRRSG
ncbi:hypothetical protein [Falsirhodobacter sp. 20TX0035]|uniref:hypothetical protein n=1 Tax=Falsirhodobacter sp. 20TX0035 TaxID=3022019 RepID=UPI00232F7A1F|nr:hypothetical protein [Falsirhodobacter sp. 20TX0035]MDB6453634.1 hypothetical protein [Falsirhodobacter sp. 20TX0035]